MIKTEFDELFPAEAEPDFTAYSQAPEPYQPRSRPRKERQFSKRMVIILLIIAIAMITAVYIFNWSGRQVQDSIIYVGLAAILGEWAIISSITRKDKEIELARIKNGHREAIPENQPEVL